MASENTFRGQEGPFLLQESTHYGVPLPFVRVGLPSGSLPELRSDFLPVAMQPDGVAGHDAMLFRVERPPRLHSGLGLFPVAQDARSFLRIDRQRLCFWHGRRVRCPGLDVNFSL